MPKSVAQWSRQIREALNNADPQISTEIGDPIRKVIDAVASVASATELNSQVNQSFLDLDSKTGADLDALASWLGFGRRDGVRAVGEVRFYVDQPARMPVSIPAGTQVTDGNVMFSTLSSVVLAQYTTEVFARIQCATVGTSGNVNAYAINQVATSVATTGLRVENRENTVNGSDVESDAELRRRIRATFLRNVAGTEDAYMGVSDRVNGTDRVNVLGPVERWEEQLEVVELPDELGGGYGFRSMIPCSKYTWPHGSYLVREPDTDNERVYVAGQQYEVDRTTDPTHPIVRIAMTEDMLNLDGLSGAELDRAGEALGLPRYTGDPATGTVSFRVRIGQAGSISVRAGARLVTNDGHWFVTKTDATIYSGGLQSSDVPVYSEECLALSYPNGTALTYRDRSGMDCLVVREISGGAPAWTDDEYRERIAQRYSESMDVKAGDMLYFEHEYCPRDSRNDPSANPPVTNRVDVFVDGMDVQPIREVSMISPMRLTDDSGTLPASRFYYEDGSQPSVGTEVELLGYAPVASLPESINVNGANYIRGTHYDLVRGMDDNAGSVREVDGIAWLPGQERPADGGFSDITYDYNRTIVVTDQLLSTNRQICTDVLAHEAHRVGLTINVIVQAVLGTSDDAMMSSINQLLDDWARDMTFGQWIQRSDLEMTIRQAVGVDACRLATPDDTWRTVNLGDDVGNTIKSGIQTHETFRHYLEPQYDEDFRLWDSMLPSIYAVNVVRTASNTYDPSYRPEP